jgi:hypothetical protein
MSVAAPAYRFEREDLPRLAPQVVAAAGELSRRIGSRSPDEGTGPWRSGAAQDEEGA